MRLHGIALSGYEPEYQQEQEPTIERGKDISRFWVSVLVVIIISAIVIGYAASASYTKYPFDVNVSGTLFSSNGGQVNEVALPACSEFLYNGTQCPNPAEQPSDGCYAAPDMNMPEFCNTYVDARGPGYYSLTLKNGEDYAVTATLSFKNGTFDKVCVVNINLKPQTVKPNITKNLTC